MAEVAFEPAIGNISKDTLHKYHKNWLRGINVPPGEQAAVSIRFVINSDYSNIWIKENETLSYSGQGKPKDGDQVWNRDNLGLRIAFEEGRPIMVFQTIKGRPPRYYYHGKWYVTNYHIEVIEATGQRIFRFTISKNIQKGVTLEQQTESCDNDGAVDIDQPAARVMATTYRIIRDTEKSKKLKESYNSICQVCKNALYVRGQPYAEAHHLKPLGGEHKGADSESNMLVLCPNHHAQFDMMEIAIDPADGKTVVDSKGQILGELLFRTEHRLRSEFIQYHYERFRATK